MSSLLIKNAVIPGTSLYGNQKVNILVVNGTIQDVAIHNLGSADRVIDADGLLVSPGLIDIHAHVAPTIPLSVHPDEAGVSAGVCTVCDAGSLGWRNFHSAYQSLNPKLKTDVYHFIHIAPDGEAELPETGYEKLEERQIDAVIQKNPDRIIGIKARAVKNAVEFKDYKVLQKAAEIAHRHDLPLMVHLGDRQGLSDDVMYQVTTQLIDWLEPGDILTHVFTPAPGGLLRNRKIISGVKQAIDKGILLDLSPGMGHTSFDNIKAALDAGIKPDLFGTDVVKISGWRRILTPHFYNLCAIASKLIALGYSLDETIDRITINAAKAINRFTEIGSIEAGKKAHFTIIEKMAGSFIFHDGGMGNTIWGNLLLSPKTVIKSGEIIDVSRRVARHRTDRGLIKFIAQRSGKEFNG